MSFVVGQKVICTNNLLVDHLSLNTCYEVTGHYVYQNLTQVRNDLGELFWYNSCRFKEHKPTQKEKEMTEKYEIVKPFTLIDIWDAFKENHSCKEFLTEWGNLFKEQMRIEEAHCSFDTFNDIEYSSKVLMRNLHHLEEKGLIKKIQDNIVLKPAMRLKTNCDGMTYRIINCSKQISSMEKFSILVEDNDFGYNYGEVFHCRTLEELNNFTGESFEVIDGD